MYFSIKSKTVLYTVAVCTYCILWVTIQIWLPIKYIDKECVAVMQHVVCKVTVTRSNYSKQQIDVVEIKVQHLSPTCCGGVNEQNMEIQVPPNCMCSTWVIVLGYIPSQLFVSQLTIGSNIQHFLKNICEQDGNTQVK